MYNNSNILSKVLTGINSSLNIANKVVPIYKQAKPLINGVSKTYKNFKNNKNDLKNILKVLNNTKSIDKEKVIDNNVKISSNINNPTFFI